MTKDATIRRLLSATVNLSRSSRTDGDLLRLFVDGGDESAFEVLVKRHTNLVLGVCRRSLLNGQDAEDACQAVFLILSKKAKSERWQSSIANWLYSTARKVSRNARLVAERRARKEERAGRVAAPRSVSPLDQMTGRELLAALDDELERLPAIYREPLVLCHFEGLSRNEVATRLGIGSGTIKIRLERGRKKLADALGKRGIELGAGLIAIAAASSAGASSPRLLESILTAVNGSPSASVAAIAKGAAVNLYSLKMKLVALASVVAAAMGFGLASRQVAAGPRQPAIEWTKSPVPKEVAKANASAKYLPIDPETIAAYEKLGAKYGGFVVDDTGRIEFFPRNENGVGVKGLPGFCFKGLQGMLPDLPPVKVPFGLALQVADEYLKKLKDLKNLTSLDLRETRVTDAGLKELKDLKNLTALALRSTQVTDAGLKEFATLENLTSLSLQYTQVTDAGLEELKVHKNLTTLNLYNSNGVTDGGLKELKNLKNLASISLQFTQVTDAGLKELKNLKNLASLDLGHLQLTGAGLKELKDLKNLTSLNLEFTKVTDAGLEELKDLKNLTSLDLGFTQVTDASMKELKVLKNLASLNLSATKVTDLEELKDLKNLTTLKLDACRQLTDAGLTGLKDLENLTTLNLEGCQQLTDAGLKDLKDLKNLTSLNLGRTKLTDAGLKELKGLKNLTSLHLGQTQVTGAGLKDLKDLKSLTSLYLYATQVTDAGLKDLKDLKNLNTLYLYSTQVTDAGLKELKDLKNLNTLILGSTQVTDAGLKELKDLKNLTLLHLGDTKVTDAGLKELKESLPRCAFTREPTNRE